MKKYGKYPELSGEDDEADFEEVVDFLLRLRCVFKWDVYEKETLGKKNQSKWEKKAEYLDGMLLYFFDGSVVMDLAQSSIMQSDIKRIIQRPVFGLVK